jgi:hypothetical protein
MKLLLVALLLSFTFCLNVKDKYNQYFTWFKPIYYDYVYTPYYYYYYPTTYYYYRKEGNTDHHQVNKTEIIKPGTEEDAKKELKALKTELFKDADFDTAKMRANAYDEKWLIQQLKLTRALQIEDFLKTKSKKTKNMQTGEEKPQSSGDAPVPKDDSKAKRVPDQSQPIDPQVKDQEAKSITNKDKPKSTDQEDEKAEIAEKPESIESESKGKNDQKEGKSARAANKDTDKDDNKGSGKKQLNSSPLKKSSKLP